VHLVGMARDRIADESMVDDAEVSLLNTVGGDSPFPVEEMQEDTSGLTRKPPRAKAEAFPWKEFILALSLTMGGLVCLPLGLYELLGRHDLKRALPFLCISPFVLAPGIYHLAIIIRAYLGHRGYRYSMVVRRPH